MTDTPTENKITENTTDNDKTTEDTNIINIKVVSQDGNEIFFKLKRTTPFRKLMDAYANRTGAGLNTLRFLFDGQRMNEDQTPASLDMEDQDSIDVMIEQQGGVY